MPKTSIEKFIKVYSMVLLLKPEGTQNLIRSFQKVKIVLQNERSVFLWRRSLFLNAGLFPLSSWYAFPVNSCALRETPAHGPIIKGFNGA